MEKNVDDLIEFLSLKFENIILLGHKYAALSSSNTKYDLDISFIEEMNSKLQLMHIYLEKHKSINLITLDDDLYCTGTNVEWGGPYPTHYINGSYWIYREKIAKEILKNFQYPSIDLQKYLVETSMANDDLKIVMSSEKDSLEDEIRQANKKITEYAQIIEKQRFEIKKTSENYARFFGKFGILGKKIHSRIL